MNEKKILIVSDMVGVGSVALSAMIPVMSTLETNCSYLPTAMVSNNFGYGEVALYDLSEYIRKCIEVWNKLNFEFDIIVTGIVLSTQQVELIEQIIFNQTKKPIVISDPIMGDHGDFYDSLSDELYKTYLQLIQSSNIVTPNITELSKILEKEYQDIMTHELVCSWLEEAKLKGIESIALTSVHEEEGHFVYTYENFGEIHRIAYDYLPYEFGGTGDIFTSIISACIARDMSLYESSQKAVTVLSEIIKKESKTNRETMKIIKIEKYLSMIKEILSISY